MDISNITDKNQLKAMAYDQLVLRDQAERNLAVINERLAMLEQNNSSAGIPTTESEDELTEGD